MADIENRMQLGVSEGVALAALPVLGSLLAFAYEAGRLTYYEVPFAYLEVNLQHLVVATAVVGTPLIAMFVNYFVTGSGVLDDPFRRRQSWLRRIFQWVFLVLLALCAPLVVLVWSLDDEQRFRSALAGTGLYALAVIVFIVGIHFAERWLALRRLSSGTSTTIVGAQPISIDAAKESTRLVTLGLFMVGGLTMTSAYGGYSTAASQSRFWTLQSAGDYFLVSRTGDVHVYKRFDRNTQAMLPEVLVLKADSKEPIRMTRTALPNLHRAEASAKTSR